MENKINLGPITSWMKEESFYRKGMTTEEWFKEKEYQGQHFDEYIAGTYVPLWKQK